MVLRVGSLMYLKWIEWLEKYETIEVTPHGNSMRPKILSGQLITISSDISNIEKGDIVFCKVNGYYYVHLVTAVKPPLYQISNNHGHVNGWTNKIYGKVIRINNE